MYELPTWTKFSHNFYYNIARCIHFSKLFLTTNLFRIMPSPCQTSHLYGIHVDKYNDEMVQNDISFLCPSFIL